MKQTREVSVGERSTTVHFAMSPGESRAGVLVLHPWWGLNEDVIGYAERLASEGFTVAAPDLYEGRLATTIEEADALSSSLDEDLADAFVLATVDTLNAEVADPDAKLASVGFSMGAAWALWLPAQRPEVVASIVYYGTMTGPSLSRADTPVLGHFAETDEYEPDESVAAFEATLRSAGRTVELHRYPGTGHWFAEPSQDAYVQAAATLAFDRTVEFLRRELVSASA
jgi:carboxymethylenebutenolidase